MQTLLYVGNWYLDEIIVDGQVFYTVCHGEVTRFRTENLKDAVKFMHEKINFRSNKHVKQ